MECRKETHAEEVMPTGIAAMQRQLICLCFCLRQKRVCLLYNRDVRKEAGSEAVSYKQY